MVQRSDRLNPLLQQKISEVIRTKLNDPKISHLVTVTKVSISPDFSVAKVYISVIGSDEERNITMKALRKGRKHIKHHTMQEVVMKRFPNLRFFLDDSAQKFDEIDRLLQKVRAEEEQRGSNNN